MTHEEYLRILKDESPLEHPADPNRHLVKSAVSTFGVYEAICFVVVPTIVMIFSSMFVLSRVW